MRIDLNTNALQIPDSTGSTKSGQRGSAASAGSGMGEDVARLSSQYSTVRALTAAVSLLPEIRQDRVEALSQKIQNGTYAVTSEQTAEGLISQMAGRPAA